MRNPPPPNDPEPEARYGRRRLRDPRDYALTILLVIIAVVLLVGGTWLIAGLA